MVSSVDCANRALSLIGTRSTISALNESSNEARAVNLWYNQVRDRLLRGMSWGFATRYVALGLLKTARGVTGNPNAADGIWHPDDEPPRPWLYEYTYPSDCLRLFMIQGQNPEGQAPSPVPIFASGLGQFAGSTDLVRVYQKATDVINNANTTVLLTNAKQAIAQYVMRVTDENRWDPLFCKAFEYALAACVAMSLSIKPGLTRTMAELAAAAMTEAAVEDGNEQINIYDVPTDWIMARDGSFQHSDATQW